MKLVSSISLIPCRRMQVLRRVSQEKNMAEKTPSPEPESLTPDISDSISKSVSHGPLTLS